MPHKVFISYAAEDKRIADAVCEAIEAHGVNCWYAPRDVPYGKDFDEAIVDAISTSRLVILILSAYSNSSEHVKREIRNACMDDVGVPVLPVRVEDVALNKALRYYIGAAHWLDAVTPPFESHLHSLVQHVEARLPKTAPLPTLVEAESDQRITRLKSSAKSAIATGDWATAVKTLEELLRLDPKQKEVEAQLAHARQRQQLADLYENGLEHFKAGEWLAALEQFRRLGALERNYKM